MERSVRQFWAAAEEEKGEGGVGKEEKKEEEEKSGRKKKVRIVVTRAELEWLMEQLGEKQGGRRLEDLLQEMAEIMEFRKEDQISNNLKLVKKQRFIRTPTKRKEEEGEEAPS
ncbi:hypothetical protein AXF42_Ash021236 [Apostasia shenzhenica]|uniref:Uncharacterized protein n=1 Tax=Apostasia shenzhenica TaxID=1088818 RepID=A0A2H9ZRW1_9ASPA|nr:hypothetical protein AXF42_Ash021236 [Apostasia shenzhenica]